MQVKATMDNSLANVPANWAWFQQGLYPMFFALLLSSWTFPVFFIDFQKTFSMQLQ